MDNVLSMPATAARSTRPRFTLDGSEALEARLEGLCQEVRQGVQSIIPASKLEGLVLGGGYGRGEGGVLQTESGEAPYNDLEFYVFMRGNRWANERRYGAALHALGDRLSLAAGLHVEFKCDSLRKLRRSPISMFTYDLVAQHRALQGEEPLFEGCSHHLKAESLPLSEASRLLLNRCTGLLLAKDLLRSPTLTAEQANFIGRNLAKAELALGDAVLTAFGSYDWSCRERHQRLTHLVRGASGPCHPDGSPERSAPVPGRSNFQPPSGSESSPRATHSLACCARGRARSAAGGKVRLLASASSDPQLSALSTQLVEHHAAGVAFKLHPQRCQKSAAALQEAHRDLSLLAAQVWLWLENLRLHRPFASLEDYARARARKCPESPAWRNFLLNLRTFGPKGMLSALGSRYPRERLFNSLPLLLWGGDLPGDSSTVQFLQRQLHTGASQWADLVTAYKQVWPGYA